MSEIRLQQEGSVYAVCCRGHALGEPAACAGISALLWAAAGWLTNEGERVQVASCDLCPGDASLVWKGGGEGSRAVWDLLVIGLLQIAKRYPEAVCVKKI